MLVRQLIGSMAGQIIDLPYAEAQNCLAAGTVADPNAPVNNVKGLAIDPKEDERILAAQTEQAASEAEANHVEEGDESPAPKKKKGSAKKK